MKDASIIKFALSKSGNVKIDVYNSAGRRVVALINGTMGAGYHTVRWQRKDGSGRILPRGTYFIRLKTESITDVKKIVILN
jgi:flagellar hook assembly protein FlgD